MGALDKVVVLIPAYEPADDLAGLVEQLQEKSFRNIVVVDDGSTRSRGAFDCLAAIKGCDVVPHGVNLGKGRALKTGLNHILVNYPNVAGVVTADADGQHLPADVARVAEALVAETEALILGSRKFAGSVPLRSLAGNMLTRLVMRFVSGLAIADTQTGLRGIPLAVVPRLLRLEGEQYEYEMNMLLSVKEQGIRISEVPIETVYLDGNSSSHFNPFLDSMKIYFVLLRFSLSSFASSLVDQLFFFFAISAGVSVGRSMIIGRCVASVVNLAVNRNFVFHSRADLRLTLLRYYFSMAIAGYFAYLAIQFCVSTFGTSVMATKVAVECVLFFISFVVNREFVFASGGQRREVRDA